MAAERPRLLRPLITFVTDDEADPLDPAALDAAVADLLLSLDGGPAAGRPPGDGRLSMSDEISRKPKG